MAFLIAIFHQQYITSAFQASVIHQDFMRFVHVDDQHTLENNLKLVPSPPEQVREYSIVPHTNALKYK